MSLSTLLLLIFIALLGIYAFVLLMLNKTIVHLDLLFLELDLQLGHIILTSALLGIFIAIILEIIFFSSKKKNKDE
tara:strand:- start:48 stop:275 length:228 start_codon:yes stop_codon:yes gene_type:complete